MGGNRSLLLLLIRISTGAAPLSLYLTSENLVKSFCQLGLVISQLEIMCVCDLMG